MYARHKSDIYSNWWTLLTIHLHYLSEKHPKDVIWKPMRPIDCLSDFGDYWYDTFGRHIKKRVWNKTSHLWIRPFTPPNKECSGWLCSQVDYIICRETDELLDGCSINEMKIEKKRKLCSSSKFKLVWIKITGYGYHANQSKYISALRTQSCNSKCSAFSKT